MRETTLINHGWYFKKDTDEVPTEIPEDAVPTDLPHTWNNEDGTDGGNDYFRGKCLYVRRLSLDELPRAKTHYIEFRGVNSCASVYLNGKLLGTHKGGYSIFRFPLGEDLKAENLLAVIADNSNDKTVYPMMADFTFYGGIYRDAFVISLGEEHFELDCYGADGIKVTPRVTAGNSGEVDVEVFVTGGGEGLKLDFEITNRAGTVIAKTTTEAKNNRQTFKIDNARLWQGIHDPYLYTATVTLCKMDEKLDTVCAKFGIRAYHIDPEHGFFLNGKPYPLHGVSRHQDRAGVGNALLKSHHDEDMALILEIGANTVRLAHYQHDQYFYDLCDKYGLIVWAEIPYISRHVPEADENALLQMKELVLQNYNHPSICFWGLSNEITMADGDNPDLLCTHEKLNSLVKDLDQTRLTGIACVSTCKPDHPYIKIPDVVGFNHYFGWYGGNTSMNGPWFDDFHKLHPNIPVCITEYGAEALNWHSSDPKQGDYTEEYQAYYHEELIKQLFCRDYIFATFVWNMFDFGADARAEGGENGMNHKGLVSFDRKYKKDAFYAYKAQLSAIPFVHIAGKRYKKRAEALIRVTVYSNLPEIELFINGTLHATQKSNNGFFKFEVPIEEKVTLTARGKGAADCATFERVDTFPEEYILKEKGAVLNWFDIDAPEGYFSLNDEIGEIIKTVKGNIWFMSFWTKFAAKLNTGVDLDRNMLSMLGGFTVLRCLNTLGSLATPLTKEEMLKINESLNKIKKPDVNKS